MFESYQKFVDHDRTFNIVFSTLLSIALTVTAGWVLALAGFYNNQGAWVSVIFLAIIPVFVFLAHYGRSELRTAYYKLWRDRLTGIRDRRKILQDFARKYHLDSWRVRLKKVDVDGRWKFHANTRYTKELTDDRDMLLNQIHQDCITVLEHKDDEIIIAQREVKNANINLAGAKKTKGYTEQLLKDAESSEEVFAQRCNLKNDEKKIRDAEIAVNNAEHELKRHREERNAIVDEYYDTIYRVKKSYYNRYRKYSESSVKKINRINRLKYEIEDMPDVGDWSIKNIRKEQK